MTYPVQQLLHGRFELLSEIGHGSQGRTYQARDTANGDIVAAKMLDIKSAEHWQAYELFDREVATLGRLNHPSIPRLIDAFNLHETQFWLVQSFVFGQNLEVMLREGHLFNSAQLEEIAKQILNILTYLHGQNPAIFHRDIKPSNLIFDGDGLVHLVDFGGVQNADSGGSTVVGTVGYMPPEQMTGRAVPSSDLYALGATLIHLATRTHPSDFPVTRLKMQWRGSARLSEPLLDWMDSLVEPEHEDRPISAHDALRSLLAIHQQHGTIAEPPNHGVVHPSISRSPSGNCTAEVQNGHLELTLRPGSVLQFAMETPQVWALISLILLLVVFGAGTKPSLWILVVLFTAHTMFNFYREWTTLVLAMDPEKTELRSDGKIIKSTRTSNVYGPVKELHRALGVGLSVTDDTWILRQTISKKEIEWIAHQILKYLTSIRT